MADSLPRITVAICTRNRAAFLETALRSLMPQLTEADELLIIDNASVDNTPAVTQRFAKEHPKVQVYREEKPGLSFARNAAHRLGRAEWVLFLDDDAVVRPGWIQAYVDFINRHKGERIGCVGGACVPNYEMAPPAWHNDKSDRYELGPQEYCIAVGHRTPGGGNCAYNTAAVREVGGFCNELKRAEDTDMHHRLQRAGYGIWWLPGAPIDHFMSRGRLRFWNLAKAAFYEGRAYGRLRLRQKASTAEREVYRWGRILICVPNVIWYLVSALFTFPMRGGRLAARAFHRAMRVVGMTWQMTADLVLGKFSYR
jgi:glycosyltransferase involved in cell wall biosynthesis